LTHLIDLKRFGPLLPGIGSQNRAFASALSIFSI